MRASQFVPLKVLLICLTAICPYLASAQLHADFTATPTSGCAPLLVSFTDQSTGNPTSRKWDFGNGTISNNNNSAPSTTYFNPGVYTVKLIISNGSSTDSIVKTSFITVYDKPHVDFTASSTSGCFPLNVSFTDKTTAGSGTITNWLWDLGDGNTSVSKNPLHTYLSAGSFDITLNVTNSFGCSAAVTKSNLIQISSGVNADFSIDSINVCHSPANFNFTNLSAGTGTLNYSWTFGDGGVSSQVSPKHPYVNEGNYTVKLLVQSSTGCSDTISKTVSVAFVHSSFSSPDTVCSNRQFQFINTSTPTPTFSNWDFGDGSNSTTLSPFKTFLSNGSFTVKVINRFAPNCTDSTSKTITVNSGPAASFTADDTASCTAPLTVNFQNTTTGSAISYKWDFGDGNTSTLANPSHTYTSNGIYTVTLIALNSNGCEDVFVKTDYIKILPLRITGFSGLPDSSCIPHTIHPSVLLNISATITSYLWDFGDGTTSTLAHPSHTYSTEGFYKVSVSITTAGGCPASYSLDSAVLVGHKPHADFTWSPTDVCPNVPVHFVNTSTGGPLHFMAWSYNGYTVTPFSPNSTWGGSHVDTGWHFITLIVWDYGCSDTITKINAVYVKPPIAKIKFRTNCTNRLDVNFADSSLGDKTWKWDFGDGKTDTARNPLHDFSASGNYYVQLFTSNGGCADTANVDVKVVDEHGIVQITDSTTCRNQNLNFTVSNVNAANIATTTWDYGNGTIQTVNGISTSYSYTLPGTYDVSVIVRDILGCKDTLNIQPSISVYGPKAGFSPVETGACKNATIDFTDNSGTDGVHPITSWTWLFGDNSNIKFNKPPFNHNYTDTGYFDVQLIVKDSYGCADTIKKNNLIHITQPYAKFSISDTVVCPGKQVSFLDSTVGDGLQYNWVFGDGTRSANISPSHLYTTQGTYTAQLFVTDENNCRDSASSVPIIVSVPTAKFLMSDSFSTCPPLSVNFTNQSVNFKSFSWSFGDGSTSLISNPTHIYTYPGVYPVKLVMLGNGTCADSLTKNITIKGPTGTFSYDKKPVCFPAVTQFNASAQNTSQYLWDFSDGNTIVTNTNISQHTYDTGYFVPKLILIDAFGCKVPLQGTDTVKVYDVSAKGVVQNNQLCDSGFVMFKDSSVSNDLITGHQWIFGDGTTSNQATVSHYYSSSGVFNVKLIAITQTGCSDTLVVNQAVKVVQSPVINISGDSAACVPASMLFNGNIVRADTSSLNWSWDFGNGSIAAVQNPPAAIFAASGNYTVSLIAVNSSGCSDTSYKNISVHPAPPVDAGLGATVCKSASYTLVPAGAVTYIWNASPYLSCTNCTSPIATPDTSMTFTVTGKDAIGCTATDSVLIKVTPPLSITASKNDTLCNGASVRLQASGAQSYQWFPPIYLDDPKSAQPLFTASKDTSITYHVIGTDDMKCFSDTGSVTVKVYPVPQMQILQKNITLEAGNSVMLTTSNSPDITSWKWEPPTGLNNPNVPNPIASPVQSTTFVCAAVNGGGCLAREAVTVTVVCGNSNIFIPNTFSPNNDGVNDKFYVRGKGLFSIKSFRVFNRWGQLVYEKLNGAPNDASSGWDGNFNLQKMPSDVYVYMIEILCTNNAVIPVKGNITLLR